MNICSRFLFLFFSFLPFSPLNKSNDTDTVNLSPGVIITPKESLKRKIDQATISPQQAVRPVRSDTIGIPPPGLSGMTGISSSTGRNGTIGTTGTTGTMGTTGTSGMMSIFNAGNTDNSKNDIYNNRIVNNNIEEDEDNADLDAQLIKLPIGIFESFNTGDLQHLRNLIKENMTVDCLFKTMMIDQPLIGRHIYSEFWSKLSVSHPDMVFILKKVRTDKIDNCNCIKFNYFFTGTNTFPGATETYYYNNDDYLTKNLDRSKYSEKEKNAVNLLVAQHRAHGTPYVAFGRGSGVYKLTPGNKVCSIYFEWKLTSICPPVGESS